MDKSSTILMGAVFVALCRASAAAQPTEQLSIEHSDQFEVVLEGQQWITHVVGHVKIKTESGYIYCDSAVWKKGQSIQLNGRVLIDDQKYKLAADSVFYNTVTQEAHALGSRVELWSYEDSLYAAGSQAYYDRKQKYFTMENRPVLYIGYPDSANMIEIVSDFLQYRSLSKRAEAVGDVRISSKDIFTVSGCAVLRNDRNILDLFDKPKAKRAGSTVSGELISVVFSGRALKTIDVIDSAKGEFVESVDSAAGQNDRSVLSGRRIIFSFQNGALDNILCYGQAYSWYYPSARGGMEYNENTVSGDTIRFAVKQEKLRQVDVIGGAVGTFIHGQMVSPDSVASKKVDTIDYDASHIVYDLGDSLITMRRAAHARSRAVGLTAHLITFDTHKRLIEAFSAQVDTVGADTARPDLYLHMFQPNSIPVVLKDKNEEIYGDYLAYSTETEKGRIVQSKSTYENGLYYGRKLYREQAKIFYVNGGRYTTCDASEPHFHFHSSHMKLIEGEKLIAKPVVFYIERLPILAIPFYVFPLKRGRHSGFLPFTFGQFERGDRYVKNVGYYWAASQYWDCQGSFDYHEKRHNLTLNTRVDFRKIYVLDGYVAGSFVRDTYYDNTLAVESKRNRYVITGRYNHTISPSFSVSAYGDFVSDVNYYSDYSLNQDDRVNRSTKSQVSFSKKFGKNTSLTGNFTHTVNLDQGSRTDDMPTMSLSLPTIWPFGNGKLDPEGKLEQNWYQRFSFRYSPSLRNYSERVTKDSLVISGTDTTTVSYRSRKEYTKIQHNPSINLPALKLGQYLNLVPSIGYSETWFKIYETDQSRAAGIDASTTYRTYSYSAAARANTTLYGTIHPKIGGLVGLRHVLNPSVAYGFSPDIDRHPKVRAFAGGGAGSQRSQVLSFSLEQSLEAKVKTDGGERSLELVTLASSFRYDFEAKDHPYSDLSTTFQSRALGRISFDGSMTHSLYVPGTNKLSFWSPYLMDFSLNARFSIAGSGSIFDEPAGIAPGAASPTELAPTAPKTPARPGGWNFSASFRYSESGRGNNWFKRSFIDFALSFNLTPTTMVSYNQYYDFKQAITIRNSVSIVKTIHCWTGSLFWVPIGSNRGFGFKLNVTAIPEIKIDDKHDSFLQSVRRY